MFSNTSNANNSWNKSTGFSGLGTNNNSSTTNGANTGLFGNSSSSGGLFGNTATQNKPLFGSANNTNSTTFDANPTASSGSDLFQSKPQTSGGLFGQPNANTNAPTNQNINNNTANGTSTNHPYVNSSIFQGISTAYEMPASITAGMFTPPSSGAKSSSKPFSAAKGGASKWASSSNSSSIFSRIASKFNIFKTNHNETGGSENIFTSKDFPSTEPLLGSKTKNKNKITKPIAFNSIEARSSNETKKLIIKTKPLKFHLIDADKVLNSKRKRVITTLVSSDKLLHGSEDEDSDYEVSNTSIDKDQGSKRSRVMREVTSGPNYQLPGSSKVQDSVQEDGYWCSPSITELNSWSLKDLSSIENFIIGRKGYGQIAFSQPVDLSDIKRRCNELDKSFGDELFFNTVEIGLKYVKVYKDDDNKPSQGFGMNVPATISLENIEPNSGKDFSEFINMLKNKPGMEFVTYDPIMFIWVFKVLHFSIWGLVDDNDTVSLPEDEFTRELKKQRINNETNGVPGNWGGVTNEPILNIKKRLLDSEIDSQIDLYGESPSDRLAVAKVNDNILEEIEEPKEETPRIRENYEYLRQLVSVLPANVDISEIVQEKAYEPEITDKSAFDLIQPRPNIAVSDDWLVQLELTNDLNSSLSKHLSDRRFRLQENGKLNLEQVDDLLFSNLNQSADSSKEVSTPSGETDDVKMIEPIENEEVLVKDIKTILPQLLQNTTFSKRSNGYSKAVISTSSFAGFDVEGLSPAFRDAITLCGCLFDKLEEDSVSHEDSTDSVSKIPKDAKRRALLIDWLRTYANETTDQLLSNAPDMFEKVLIHLSVGDIKSAVTTSLRSKNFHLASILTLADSGFDGLSKVANSQIEEWQGNDYIPNGLRKIYQFLAGQTDVVLEELPWEIQLASKVYYSDLTVSLKDIIGENIKDSGEDDMIVDILGFYHSKTHAKANLSNLQVLTKWVMSSILQDDVDDATTLRVGKLTDQLGLWKESLYVYSHLINDEIAEKSTREVIRIHIKDIKDDKTNIDEEPYLVSTLRVPSTLIYESVATEMTGAKEYWKACDAYITARAWDKAHQCIAQNLGPTIVVSKDIVDIRRLQRILGSFPDGGNIIPTWSQGAGVFQQYFNLLPYIREAKVPSSKETVESLLDNIPLLKLDGSLTATVATAIISKDIGELAIDLKVDNVKERIEKLPLGENELEYFKSRI